MGWGSDDFCERGHTNKTCEPVQKVYYRNEFFSKNKKAALVAIIVIETIYRNFWRRQGEA